MNLPIKLLTGKSCEWLKHCQEWERHVNLSRTKITRSEMHLANRSPAVGKPSKVPAWDGAKESAAPRSSVSGRDEDYRVKPVILLQVVMFSVGLGLSPSVGALDSIPVGATNSPLFPGPDYRQKLQQAKLKEKLNEEQQRREKRLEVQRSLPQFIKDANAEHLASTPITATPDPATASPVSLLQILQAAVVVLLIVGLVARRLIRRRTHLSDAKLKSGRFWPASALILPAIDLEQEEAVSQFTLALVHRLPSAGTGPPSPPNPHTPKPPATPRKMIPTHPPVYYKRSAPKRHNNSLNEVRFSGKNLASHAQATQQKTAGEQNSPFVPAQKKICPPESRPVNKMAGTVEALPKQRAVTA